MVTPDDAPAIKDAELLRAVELQLHRRRAAVAAHWQDLDTIVLVAAGDLIGRPGRDDVAYPFEAHSEFYYLTDRNLPGGVLAFDPDEGWIDFLAPVTADDVMWNGAEPIAAETRTTDQLEDWLSARSHRKTAWLGAAPGHVQQAPALVEELRFGFAEVRRIKDQLELQRIRTAQRATSAAFSAVLPLLRAGTTERELQVELEAHAFRSGADGLAFETIVGSGPNSAKLHGLPGSRRFQSGELVLIDAGFQHLGYASDVTRTYAVGQPLSGAQSELHAVVRSAELSGIELCVPGVEWVDVHLAAAMKIAEGLAGCGLLRGQPESLVESRAVSLFFPHGVGHLVGLGARDAGGTPLKERRDEPKPHPNVRMNLPLQAGMVTTVEPGIYFVPTILEDGETRRAHRDQVNWSAVDKLKGFGGIRIEDDVLVTEGGCEVLSSGVPLLP